MLKLFIALMPLWFYGSLIALFFLILKLSPKFGKHGSNFKAIAFTTLFFSGWFVQLTYFSAAVDRRPGYLQILDTTVDESISRQIELISVSISDLNSKTLSMEEMEGELSSLAVNLHILEVLIAETADKRAAFQAELNLKEETLSKKTEEVEMLAELSENDMQTFKRILFQESQQWSYLSLFLGIVISIPLFWISEAVRIKWIVPFFGKKKKTSKINVIKEPNEPVVKAIADEDIEAPKSTDPHVEKTEKPLSPTVAVYSDADSVIAPQVTLVFLSLCTSEYGRYHFGRKRDLN